VVDSRDFLGRSLERQTEEKLATITSLQNRRRQLEQDLQEKRHDIEELRMSQGRDTRVFLAAEEDDTMGAEDVRLGPRENASVHKLLRMQRINSKKSLLSYRPKSARGRAKQKPGQTRLKSDPVARFHQYKAAWTSKHRHVSKKPIWER
jgi:hypothetical protein